jgi:hypothetical protein
MYSKKETEYPTLDGGITQTEDPIRPFVKLSARWDDRNITMASYNYYEQFRSHRTYQGAFSVNYEDSLWQQNSDSTTFLLQHSFVLDENIILEGRYAGFRGGFDLIPRMENGTSKPLLWNYSAGMHMPGSSANRADVYERNRDNALVTMNYFNDDLNGSHSMKFGLEYENSLAHRSFSLTDFQYWYQGLSYIRYDYGSYEGGTVIERFAGYAQDSWSVNDRLTINIGFRIDSTGLYAEETETAPIGEDVIYRFNDPAPRIGFAYDLMGDGKTVIRGFYGRYYEGVVGGNTESFTTVTPPTKTYYGQYVLGSSAPLWTLWSSSGGSGNVAVEDDMENQYSEGFSLSVERELMENVAGSVTFIYRKDNNFLGELYPDAEWDSATANFSNARGSYNGKYYPNYNSGDAVVIATINEGDYGVLGEVYRQYTGLMFEINKRMSDNWSLKANYTYSKGEGTLGQGYGTIQGFNTGTDPNIWVNADGLLSLDRPHQLKVSGTYIAPFDIYISPVVTYYSGAPYGESVTLGDVTVSTRPLEGDYRFDSQFNIDFRVEKAFVFENRYRIGVIFDMFNVMNDDAVTAYRSVNLTSANYHVPSTVVAPRFMQVGVRFIF